ncbi:hypothetical protein ABIC45_000892 [Mucilaginibacter rubeus]
MKNNLQEDHKVKIIKQAIPGRVSTDIIALVV